MKILGFLDIPSCGINATVPYQEGYRRLMLESQAGYRLKYAFGEGVFKEIWWDSVVSDAVSENVDLAYVNRTIIEQKPELILAFGLSAEQAVQTAAAAIRVKTMTCFHPNARRFTQADLDNFAQEVRDWCLMQKLDDEN
jgi:hypothetical protein